MMELGFQASTYPQKYSARLDFACEGHCSFTKYRSLSIWLNAEVIKLMVAFSGVQGPGFPNPGQWRNNTRRSTYRTELVFLLNTFALTAILSHSYPSIKLDICSVCYLFSAFKNIVCHLITAHDSITVDLLTRNMFSLLTRKVRVCI